MLDAGFAVERSTQVGDYATMMSVDQLCVELHYGLAPRIRYQNGVDQRAKAFTEAGYGFLVVLAAEKLLMPDNDLDVIRIADDYRKADPIPGSFLLLQGEGVRFRQGGD